MSQSSDNLALTRQLEANEIAAWRTMWQAPAAEVAVQLGLGYAERGGALLIWNRAAPVFLYNRLLALGVFEPATDALTEAMLARSQAERMRCEVQLAPAAEPGDLGEKLEARGLQQSAAWLMHYRALDGELPDAAPPPGYRIERVTEASAPAWGDAILAGWQVPARAATGVLATLLPLAQHPRWSCFAAVQEATGQVVGGGALFVDRGVGGLYTDGVRATHRGRALQQALIAERLVEARRRGCEIAASQTFVASAAQRSMASQGFEIAYTRLNYVMPK